MVLPRFVRQALLGEDVTVFGDGAQTRCFIHVLDTVEALVTLCDEPRATGSVYNIGNTAPISIFELACRVIDRAGSSSRIAVVPYDQAYAPGFEELGRRHPDTTLLRGLTGWAPARTLDDAIDDVIAHESTTAAPARLAADAA
jgi:UDP-glucose 4-epimerase